MKAQVKLLNEKARLPERAHPTDVGADVFATSIEITGDLVTYGTGISISPPDGYYFELAPRSSICKVDLLLTNSIGQIDPAYTGEVMMKFRITKPVAPKVYNVGDKIGQLILHKCEYADFEQVTELKNTDRGDGGYGSTGN